MIQGLEWVQLNYQKPAVVAMSLGGDSQYALDAAVRSLVLAGVTVVVAAGNEDTDACTKSPSRWAPPFDTGFPRSVQPGAAQRLL